MSMLQVFDMRLDRQELDGVRFLLCRRDLAGNGDLETAFLDGGTDIRRHPPGRGLAQALLQCASLPGTDIVAVVRNADLVLDEDLPRRIGAAISALPSSVEWAVAAAGGLGLGDKRHLGLYASQMPRIPLPGGPLPLVDIMPDLYLVRADFARAVLAERALPDDSALESVLAIEGYLAGRLCVFLPELGAGIDGTLLARDLTVLSRNLAERFAARLPGQTVPTLAGSVALPRPEGADACFDPAGPVNLAERIAHAVRTASDPISLSIVTRTRFERPYLIRRLLASISRARRDGMALEIVLSSDAPEGRCEGQLAELRETFVNLDLRLCHNAGTAPSRVLNLVEGLRAARHDYVMVVDDDDYLDLFAFDALAAAFFAGNRPLVVTTSEVHHEVWDTANPLKPVLAQTSSVQRYTADGWRRMFTGVNRLPVCALVLPRDFACRRLEAFTLCHDLSEDYALFLLLLTAPDLPEIHEVADTVCHISLRGRENSVTMKDRRPWVRDIAGHLAALTTARAVAGAGTWALLGATSAGDAGAGDGAVADLRRSLDRSEADIRLLRRENARLRAEISVQGGRTA